MCHTGYSGSACEHFQVDPTVTCPDNCSGHGWCLPRWQVQAALLSANNASRLSEAKGGALARAHYRMEEDKVDGHKMACMCMRGWRGAACDVDTCPKHCEGRGICVRGTCACQAGWGGDSCGEKTHEPPPPPAPPPPYVCPMAHGCSGRGVCINGTCACRAGFAGTQCELVLAACPGGCSAHGRCDKLSGKCVCSLGYTGEDCGRSVCTDPLDLTARTCHGRGNCECDRATHSCSCACHVGFAPPFCANTTCPADCHSGSGQGTCVAGKCLCSPGWRGASCGVEVCPKSARPLTGSVSMAIASVLLDGVDLHVRKARALVQSKMVSPAPGVGCAM